MKKNIIGVGIFALAVILIVAIAWKGSMQKPSGSSLQVGQLAGQSQPAASYKEATFQIDGLPVALSGSSAAYFGNEARGDLNGDGREDVAFIITQQGGGSGTFYYAVVALNTDAGYVGTNAIFLGDRIAPQTTEIHDGKLVVNYADRKPTDPMTTKPSVGKSRALEVRGSLLVISE